MLTDKAEWNEFYRLWTEAGVPDRMTKTELYQLREETGSVFYRKGSHVHTPEAPCHGILLLQAGRLRIYLLSDEGREVTLYHIGAGELCILSASCVLDAITFPVFIDAEEDTRVFQVSGSCFRSLSEKNIYLRAYGYEQAVHRFSDALWAMQQILFRGVDRRLADYLLKEAEREKSSVLSIRQDKIAADIGSSREVVSRMLRYFYEEGMTRNARGRIELLDPEKLMERAGS